ncbi:MAG: sulfatase [Planctomycetota bacterium]
MPIVLFRLLGLAVLILATASASADRPPNVVIIFTDDQGYNDIGCFDSPDIRTPHLDEMAKQGMRFTDFYVASPVCSSSRAALLTGCYPERVGIRGVFFPNRGYDGLHPDEITIADLLKTKGYATGIFGKWHLGDEKPFLPTRQGFDTYYGIPYSNDMTVNPLMDVAEDVLWREGMTLEKMRDFKQKKKNWVPLMRDEEVIEYPVDQRTITKRCTQEAIAFIKQNKGKPFFVYVPHTMPHIPLFVSKDFENGNKQRGIYGDVIEEIDWSVGQIIGAIKELKLDDETLVIFTTDNGPWLKFGRNGGSALPLRDGKFTSYEGGQRVPTIVRWPGRVPAGQDCAEVAGTIDLLPTIAGLANAELPSGRMIDGKDILPLLEGRPNAKSPHEAFFFQRGAVRQGKWKLHFKARSTVKDQPVGKLPALYDLSTDIGETKNLASQHPEVVAKLKALYEAHLVDIKANSRPKGQIDAKGKPSDKKK